MAAAKIEPVAASQAETEKEKARGKSSRGRLRGIVDAFDLDKGIEGWAFDLENPDGRLAVDLVIGDAVVASTTADRPRADMADQSRTAHIGFAFPSTIFDQICNMIDMGHDGSLVVRIADTSHILPPRVPLPDLAAIFDHVRMRQATSSDGPELMGRLASLQTAGEAMVQRAVKLQRDNLCGYIEQVAVDDTGLIWITGWLRNVTAIEMPVIIATDQKFAGGMALTLFTRADLGGDASGFVAAIRSDWRPRAGGEFLIVVSETAFIQSVATPKIISKRDFADHFNHNKPNCHGGNCDALLHLLDHPDSWEPTDGLTGNQVRTTLEEVFVLPNFGCIVTGWVLSPLRPIKAFGLRFGSTVLRYDEKSLSQRARPELEEISHGCDLLPAGGGFSVVFRGVIDPRYMSNVTFKVILSDGSASNHAVDLNAVRRLGTAASVDKLFYSYPALASEPFFADLALALREDLKLRARDCTTITASKSAKAIVIALPEKRSDIFLLFDALRRDVEEIEPTTGIVIIGSSGGDARPTAMAMFNDFRLAQPRPCSLFLVQEPREAIHALPEILRAVGPQSFSFFASGIVPTRQGWGALAAAGNALVLLRAMDPAGQGNAQPAPLSAFVWRRDRFMSWYSSAKPFIGGNGENPALLGGLDPEAIEDAVWITRPRTLSFIEAAINGTAA